MIDNRRFLSLEGPEGAGKSTAARTIRDWLVARGAQVVMTREPGGTPLAEEIRTLFLAERDEPVAELAELLLVFAARAQHLDRVIRPALLAGHWVVCDRFTDATFAYQGAGRGIDARRITDLAAMTHGDLWPSTTFLLDLPAATGLGRISGALDRMEQSGATFLERVRDGYARRAAAEPERFVTIDAGQPLDGVTAALVAALGRRCGPGL